MVPNGNIKDQKAPNKLVPNVPLSTEELREIGICYWKLDASAYSYPKIAVPWDLSDAVNPDLNRLRDDHGYSYADIITVHPNTLPEYETKVRAFFEEHIHNAKEIQYFLGGSGYFDARNRSDEWVRMHVKAGDLVTLPEKIYHRFTVDEGNSIHVMRLFIGQLQYGPRSIVRAMSTRAGRSMSRSTSRRRRRTRTDYAVQLDNWRALVGIFWDRTSWISMPLYINFYCDDRRRRDVVHLRRNSYPNYIT
ncbi:hypothetical protein ACHAXA_008620 [Cyclostephanos tholiformis]|uniref:Acireductone dioxygenase n=1 Tax=Cyclostephanos tholiformis TaxID=382380 RepID=A0ABD3SP90_9STRA